MIAPAPTIRKPSWTITSGKPTAEAVEALARLCLSVARQRIADRHLAERAGQADEIFEESTENGGRS